MAGVTMPETRYARGEDGVSIAYQVDGVRYVELDGIDHTLTGDTDAIVDEVQEFVTGTQPAQGHPRPLGSLRRHGSLRGPG